MTVSDMKITSAAVYGCGTIGRDLATLLIGNSIPTVVIGHSQAGMARCEQAIHKNFEELRNHGKITEAQIQKCLALLQITGDHHAAAGAGIVFESTAEAIEIKREVYEKLESVCSADTIIASTTSALPPSKLSETLDHPERLVIAHPFQPAHLLPLIEVVGSSQTSESTLARTRTFLEESLNRVVVCLHKEIEGFLVNRIAQAMFRECLYLIESGVAEPADLDCAVRYAVGLRYASIGLLEYFDAVGFPLERSIAETIYPTLCNTTEIQDLVKRGIANGKTGISAKEGLYRWNDVAIEDFHRRKAQPYFDIFHWNLP